MCIPGWEGRRGGGSGKRRAIRWDRGKTRQREKNEWSRIGDQIHYYGKWHLGLLPKQAFPKLTEDTKMVCETFYLLLFSLVILQRSIKSQALVSPRIVPERIRCDLLSRTVLCLEACSAAIRIPQYLVMSALFSHLLRMSHNSFFFYYNVIIHCVFPHFLRLISLKGRKGMTE